MSYPDTTPQEEGFPRPDPPDAGHLPAGGAKYAVPHHQQFAYEYDVLSRIYAWSHDEALRDSTCSAENMWADLAVSTPIRDRQRPVCQQEWMLEPVDPTDPEQEALADDLTGVIERIPRFQQMLRTLLDAFFPGRSGVQLVYEWDKDAAGRGERLMAVRDWTPIHGDTLVFRYDGTIGYLVNPSLLGQPGVQTISGRGGVAKFLTPEEEQCVLVHEFEPEAQSYFRPEMAGSVHGSGYRGRIYWLWWLKQNIHRVLMDFLRKVGNGFFLAGFEAGNRDEKSALQKAMEQQAGLAVMYVPVTANRGLDDTLKHLPISLEGSGLQWKIVEAINQIIRDAILGETNANSPAPVGIGGQNAEQRGMGDDERVKYDAKDLETPMQKLVNVLARHSKPNVKPPRFKFLCDKRSPEEFMGCVNNAMQWGLTVGESEVRDVLGLPEPKENDRVLSLVQAQQATALGAVPAGVPMAGTPGPEEIPAGGEGAATPPPADDHLAAQIRPE